MLLQLLYTYCNLTYIETSMAKITHFEAPIGYFMLPVQFGATSCTITCSDFYWSGTLRTKSSGQEKFWWSVLLCNDDGHCGCTRASVGTQRCSKFIHREI